ncbi:MAG: PAS domain S-box protein, partial [Ktedonobacterales bacterium]
MQHQPNVPAAQPGGASTPVVIEAAPEQHSAEESRARLLDFLRAITDNVGEGTYALDREGHVTFMNPAAERMLGWSAVELRGKGMHEVIHFQHADGTPFPSEQCPLLQVIRTGRPERVEDDCFTRKDGSLFPVAYVSSPIVTGGAIVGAVLAFHDITAHKQLDEALRRSEREAASRASQLLAIFESIADAVLVYDREGRILQTNAADAEIFAALERPDSPLRTLDQRDRNFSYLDEYGRPIPTDQWPTARVLSGEVLRGASAVDLLVRDHDGHEVVMNASGAPIRDAEGQIVGGVLIGRDVTQRRRLEAQTREALSALMAMAEALVADVAGATEQTPFSTPNMARRLADLTRAVMACEWVSIISVEPDTAEMRAVAIAGLTAEQEQVWFANWPKAGHISDFLPPALTARLEAGEAIHIDRSQPPFNRWNNPFGSRTLLVIPMRVGDRHLGEMSLDYGAADRHFTTEEFAMGGAVAKLAAQIIERERLVRDRELARANALALAETTRRMDEFLSVAAHELKTPVTNSRLAVTLAADTLRASVAQAEDAQDALANTLEPIRRLLERTESHIERLSRLVTDVLD